MYLVDMWSLTCAPCLAEMPALHRAYAAANGIAVGNAPTEAELRGLPPVADPRIEFVSIAIEDDAAGVEAFRRETWSMPWTQAIADADGLHEIWERFGVRAIPAWVIVDADGTVLAVGGAFDHDTKLAPALERALAMPRAQGKTPPSR